MCAICGSVGFPVCANPGAANRQTAAIATLNRTRMVVSSRRLVLAPTRRWKLTDVGCSAHAKVSEKSGGVRRKHHLAALDRKADEFLACRRIVTETAEHAARHQIRVGLVDASRRHAVMRGLDDHAN